MDTMTAEIVHGRTVELAQQIDDEIEAVEPITDEASESEPPELSIEELEKIFADLD
jgi:hypothetical protein